MRSDHFSSQLVMNLGCSVSTTRYPPSPRAACQRPSSFSPSGAFAASVRMKRLIASFRTPGDSRQVIMYLATVHLLNVVRSLIVLRTATMIRAATTCQSATEYCCVGRNVDQHVTCSNVTLQRASWLAGVCLNLCMYT